MVRDFEAPKETKSTADFHYSSPAKPVKIVANVAENFNEEEQPVRVMKQRSPKPSPKQKIPKNNSFYIAPLVSDTLTNSQLVGVVNETRYAGSPSKNTCISQIQVSNVDSPLRNRQPIVFSPSKFSAGNKFRNPELEAATAQIEEQFNRLLAEGPNRRANASPVRDEKFYALLQDFN